MLKLSHLKIMTEDSKDVQCCSDEAEPASNESSSIDAYWNSPMLSADEYNLSIVGNP